MIARTSQLVVVIGTPVDEFLGPSMTIFEKAVEPDRPAPPRRAPSSCSAVRSTRGRPHTSTQRLDSGRMLRGRHLLPGAHRRGSRAGGAPRAAPDRRSGRRSGRRARGGAVRPHRDQDDPHLVQGSGAGQALHEHVALHEVRGREPVLHDRRPGGRGLLECPARDPRGLPAGRGSARPGLRRRTVPVQGRDAAGRLHERPLPDGPGRDAGQRGPARLHRVGPGASLRWVAGQDRRHPGHGLQGRVRRHAGVAVVQAAQTPGLGRGDCRGDRPVRRGRPPDDLDHVLQASDILILGAPHQAYRDLEVGGKDVVDVWGALGGGIRL